MLSSMKISKHLSVFLSFALIGSVAVPGLQQSSTLAGTGTPLCSHAGTAPGENQGASSIPTFGPGTNNRVTYGPLNDPVNLKPDPNVGKLTDPTKVIMAADKARSLAGANKARTTDRPGQPDAETLLAKLPLSFVENRGQSHKAVRFEVKARHHKVFFTPSEVVFASAPEIDGKRKLDAIRMKFDGASQYPVISGENQLPGRFNFFKGHDPAKWTTDVPSYNGVSYGQIYKGVDLVFRDAQRKIERDFLIAPGVDPKIIRMRYEGAKTLRVSKEGELVIETQVSSLTESKPQAYQSIEGRRVEVEANYKIARDGGVGFEVGDYDRSRPLVIDPILRFSTFVGGSSSDQGRGLAVDSTGIYVVGSTSGLEYPGTGTFGSPGGGDGDAFAVKLTPDGSSLIYSAVIGGSEGGFAFTTQVHPSDGTLYILGVTTSIDFPTTPGAFDTSFNGMQDYTVTRLNAAGNAFIWSTYIGGGGVEISNGGIDVYNNGDCWMVGVSGSLGPAESPNPYPVAITFGTNLSATNIGSGVATALRAENGFVITSGFWGGGGKGVVINKGNLDFVYTGDTSSPGAPVCLGVGNPFPSCQAAGFDTTFNGGVSDVLVTRFTNVGTPIGSTFIGDPVNNSSDQSNGVALDSANPPNIYVCVRTFGSNYPTTAGAFDTTFNGGLQDLAVTKLNPTLSSLVYSTYIGASDQEDVFGIAVNSAGMAHITGFTDSVDFPVTTSVPPSVFGGGGNDAFVTKLNPAGSALLLSAFIGGSSGDIGQAIRLNSAGTVATIVGTTGSANFPTTPGAFDTSFGGLGDAFVTQVDAVFNICILAPGRVVLVNLTTGDFTYCGPGGPLSGTGAVSTNGCTITITSPKANIVVDTCARSGRARLFLASGPLLMFDPNISDNQCICP